MSVLSDVITHVAAQRMELFAGKGFVDCEDSDLVVYIGMSTFDTICRSSDFCSVFADCGDNYKEFMGIRMFRVATGGEYLAHVCWRQK